MALQALVPLITYPDALIASSGSQMANAAQYLGADIHVVDLEPELRAPTSALGRLVIDVPGMLKGISDTCHVRGQEISQTIQEAANQAKVCVRTGRVEVIPERFGEVATNQTRYHDLTMFVWSRDNLAVRRAIENVIFGSGRPVLVLPELREPPNYGTVVVAWDGSRVAARAVADAEPFLTKATHVIVATVTDEKPIEDQRTAERLVEQLARRGINAEARGVASSGRTIGQTLQDEALANNAGLLVLGGYGHSRLRDFVLGGATKGILDDLRVPVLLSH